MISHYLAESERKEIAIHRNTDKEWPESLRDWWTHGEQTVTIRTHMDKQERDEWKWQTICGDQVEFLYRYKDNE